MGTSLSTASCDAPQAAPPLQQQQASSKASRQADPTPAIRAADSVSSFGGSNMEADHELKQQQQQQQHKQQQPGRSKLLALLRDRLLPLGGASLVTSGLAAPTAELQQAVLAAYQEVMDGSKQQFGELYQMGHMLGSGHYARSVRRAERMCRTACPWEPQGEEHTACKEKVMNELRAAAPTPGIKGQGG